ncbi:MAG: cysteine desulfurase NifS [Desulfitobacteriaceae bacterium]|nr:cysteine desulfurase NifS [Desulfitobacteriaceae bacterium]
MKTIYLDHSATTPALPEVVQTMIPYLREQYGNASSIYRIGRESRKSVEEARRQVANLIGAEPEEIFFTSGGTEADNMAIFGVVAACGEKGKHIITTRMEHHAILHPCEQLEKRGYDVTYLNPDPKGLLRVEDIKKAIRADTFLISIMHVNNEVGTIQPIEEIGLIAREKGIIFHTDAVQSVGKIPVDVKKLGVDLMSLSAHKIYGPKGIGALFIRRNTTIDPFIFGGGQERKRRPGTENVPGIVGFGKAAEIAQRDLPADMERITYLRDKLIDGILSSIPYTQLNGDRQKRIPNNANFSFRFVEGESLLLMLDMKNIAASSGSACTSGSTDPSHVLLAMGIPFEIAFGSLRFTLGKENTEEDIDYVLKVLPLIVERLRAMSPTTIQGQNGGDDKKEGTLCTTR